MKTEEIYNLFKECNQNVCTDTRQIIKDSMFFALKGDNFNGSRFAGEAVEKGCKYAVIDDPLFHTKNKTILVDNTLSTLQNLARFHRKKFKIPVVAITGTNGKTTTKELISAVLQKKIKTIFTSGNLNNHIGVPLTLLKINHETEIAVIEMGANHPGEINALCEIAEPEYGLITNVGKAHLEGFGSFEGVIQTKTEMYRYINKSGKGIFINSDNGVLMNNVKGSLIYTYGSGISSDITGRNPVSDPFLEFQWKTKGDNNWQNISTKLVGNYNFENVLAAICIGNYFGVEHNDIKDAIAGYTPSNNRSQVMNTADNVLVMDAYNANPSSMMFAIDNFRQMKGTDKAMIIGDMLELGADSVTEHKIILNHINESKINEIYLIGKIFSGIATGTACKTFLTVDLFNEYLKNNPLKNKLILVKGSHGIHLEKTAGFL